MRLLISLVLGLVFGVGLYVSGMTQPSKVLGFLDIFGDWDPSLAFVMAGAVAVGLVAFSFARRRGRTLLGDELRLPRITEIDAPLVVGSLIFGIGWGLSGICPGPGIVDVGFLDWRALVFVVSMAAGMMIERLIVDALGAKSLVSKEG
jgi:uncharacterized membrane protein YedE/YeeE